MASQGCASQEQTKPLVEEVANLSLQEKAGVIADAVNEYADGVGEAAKISAEDVKGELNGSVEGINDSQVQPLQEVALDKGSNSQEHQAQPVQDFKSREVDMAEKEAQKSPDEVAYVVPTVDHRSVQQPGGEDKMEVPTGVVHENAEPIDKPEQQGKGLIPSITQSVKNVFSGLTGRKGVKGSEIKAEEINE